MKLLTRLFFLFVLILSASLIHAQDTVLYQRDSVVELQPSFDCTEKFFNRTEKPTAPEKVLVVTKSLKTIKLTSFLSGISPQQGGVLKGYSTGNPPTMQDYGLVDLDKDGKKELVVMNNTGGAHCCDEFYFFKNIGPNKYQYAAKTFAGDVCVSDSNVFSYSFYQQLGYFFTCFACEYSDTSDTAPIQMSGMLFKYQKGKLVVFPGDQELRSIINDNLGKFGEQPYKKIESTELGQDDGLRKEVAFNLAVYYYSFGKNIVETQKLFNKYYKFPDAAKVWAEFKKQLQYIQKASDL